MENINVKRHEDVCQQLNNMYKIKNADYGDSFNILADKFGETALLIRLNDKILRLETLLKQEAKVTTESFEDTLLDLANYAIMGVIRCRNKRSTSTGRNK